MRCISGRFQAQTEGKRLVTPGFLCTEVFCGVGFIGDPDAGLLNP
jgi:hypothetical protein